MIACDFPGDNLQFMGRRDLANQFSHTKSHVTGQNGLAVPWDPDHMNFQVALRVRTKPVASHATKLN
jgi:hypothetical protein